MTDPVLSSLVRINRQRIRDLRRRLAPCGYLGVMHLIVLYVRRHPGARQEDVACFYAVDKTSVARDARRLEDMGHLRREVDPDNRRQYQLYPLPIFKLNNKDYMKCHIADTAGNICEKICFMIRRMA